jgi:sporulation protein YlmC with PRC-barrel domain
MEGALARRGDLEEGLERLVGIRGDHRSHARLRDPASEAVRVPDRREAGMSLAIDASLSRHALFPKRGDTEMNEIRRTAEGARIVGTPDPANEGPGPRVMASSTLEGDEVVNRQGEKLGTIDEIMLDVPSGRIAYAVLSSGGFLGIGDRMFAIPWRALTLDTENKCFVLDVAKDRLEAAPGFDKDHWPAMADERWGAEVHRYYGQLPYWE